MSEKYHVSASPHVRSDVSTKKIMRDVCIALLPATLFGIGFFGVKALLVILATCATCVLTEYVYQKCMHLPITTGDYSALVTGILLALNLPSSAPLWMCVIGGVFAILIVKQLFGGLGQNFMNPALAARCFLLIAFTGRMTSFAVQKAGEITAMNGYAGVDGVSSPTPLAVLKAGGNPDLMNMFIGNIGGTIGETSVIAILLGAIYLLAKRIISLKIPLLYIGTFAVFVLLFGGHGFDGMFLLKELCGGGLMLGAFFMATDYVTSPITSLGKIIFGILLGIVTGIFRIFGASAEGVSYAIILCNILVPLIERWTVPKPFGYVKQAKKGKEAA